jgi:shikimate kinase
MIPDRIFIVGFLGSPKKEVGKALAARLERPCFDLEEVIEAGARMTTKEIFRKEGDNGYRQRERRATVAAATGPPAVVVTGAGTFVDRGNRRTIVQGGVSVYVECSLEQCLAGAIERGQLRPDEEANERFTTLYEVRTPEYEHADLIIDSVDRDPEVVADDILQSLEDRVWAENLQ